MLKVYFLTTEWCIVSERLQHQKAYKPSTTMKLLLLYIIVFINPGMQNNQKKLCRGLKVPKSSLGSGISSKMTKQKW